MEILVIEEAIRDFPLTLLNDGRCGMEVLKISIHHICSVYEVYFRDIVKLHEDVAWKEIEHLVYNLLVSPFYCCNETEGMQTLCKAASQKKVWCFCYHVP